MSLFNQRDSGPVDAFRWNGGILADQEIIPSWARNLVKPPEPDETVLPAWAVNMALHSPGDGTLHVPTRRSTDSARPGDWIVQYQDGTLGVMTDAEFVAAYEPVNADALSPTTKAGFEVYRQNAPPHFSTNRRPPAREA